METVVMDLGSLWAIWIWPIMQFVIGLSLVIFVHELGHFLTAKAVGIKVERFALGFGPRVLGFKKGETEYCLCALPLGGYVKMLGQEDFKPLEDTAQLNPRSYNAKSVGARMAVISAGVVMNVIFAAMLFVVVCLIGIRFTAPIVGSTRAGYPADEVKIEWEQPNAQPDPNIPTSSRGLRAGDRILAINGKTVNRFGIIKVEALLADPSEQFEMTIQRELDGHKLIGKANIGVKKSQSGLAFGIYTPVDTVFGDFKDYIGDDPFQPDDKVVAIAGKPVVYNWDIKPIQEKLDGKAVTVTVKRNGEMVDIPDIQPALSLRGGVWFTKDGGRIRGELVDRNREDKTVTFRLADGANKTISKDDLLIDYSEILDILGMVPRMKIVGVAKDSPARKAGLLPGDVILNYGDRGTPTLSEFREISRQFVGQATNIVVHRDGSTLAPMQITPKSHDEDIQIGIMQGIDLMHTFIAGVRPGSPAALAGIEPEVEIEKVNGKVVGSWIDVFNAVKDSRDGSIEITFSRGVVRKTVELENIDERLFDPGDYGLTVFSSPRPFKVVMGPKLKMHNPLAALAWGAGETYFHIIKAYATLRSLIIGTVSTDQLHGPVGIATIAITLVREGPVQFMYFIAYISAILAVFNFLPLPVMDGGHAVLLIVEKIRGRPLPVKVMNLVQMIGLALILLIFVAITWNDIARIIRERW